MPRPPQPFDDFRACISADSPDSLLRLMPIEEFARRDRQKPPVVQPEADAATAMIAALKLPHGVARLDYPRQCRIRRVRVPARPDEDFLDADGPVIVSIRALEELRGPRTT